MINSPVANIVAAEARTSILKKVNLLDDSLSGVSDPLNVTVDSRALKRVPLDESPSDTDMKVIEACTLKKE